MSVLCQWVDTEGQGTMFLYSKGRRTLDIAVHTVVAHMISTLVLHKVHRMDALSLIFSPTWNDFAYHRVHGFHYNTLG